MVPESLGLLTDPSAVEIRLAVSAAIVAVLLVLRWLLLGLIRRGGYVLSDKQRWRMTLARNASSGLIVLALFIVWAPEIEEFALSITAVAVALAIATKELILCVSGAAWRGASGAFGVGDWIEIGDVTGEVIDETILATVVQELDPQEYRFTGRTVTVPNALLLSQPVINHNFRKRFLHHEFTLYAEPASDAPEVRDAIAAALVAASDEFQELARRYASVIEKRMGIRLPDPEPCVRLETTEFAKTAYRCVLFCPRDRAVALEQVAAQALWSARGVRAAGQP